MRIQIQICCHASWDNDCHPRGTLQYQMENMKPNSLGGDCRIRKYNIYIYKMLKGSVNVAYDQPCKAKSQEERQIEPTSHVAKTGSF